MVIELSYFRSDFSNLPTLKSIFTVEDPSVLLLELPQLRVHVKRLSKVGVPLLVPILWQLTAINIELESEITIS